MSCALCGDSFDLSDLVDNRICPRSLTPAVCSVTSAAEQGTTWTKPKQRIAAGVMLLPPWPRRLRGRSLAALMPRCAVKTKSVLAFQVDRPSAPNQGYRK